MTRRQLVLGGVVAAAVIAAIVVYLGRDRTHRPAATLSAKPPPRSGPARGERGIDPELDLIVDPDRAGALRLEGQVIDATNDPVAGARVTLSSNPPRTVTTEDDGSFVFTGLLGRSYQLVARAHAGTAGPVTTRLTANTDPVILRLRPAATIEVTVVTAADHLPVAGATVELRGVVVEQVATDALGLARIEAVPPGRHELVAWAPGYAQARTRIRVAAAAVDQKETLALRVGAEVSGRVIGDNGAPVAGARVIYAGASDWSDRGDLEFDAVLTGDDGGFRFAALPAGTYRFSAHHTLMAPGESDPITLDGITPTRDVEIQVARGAVVAGRVVDSTGAPASGAAVRIAAGAGEGGRGRGPGRGRRGRGGGGQARQTFTDQDGRFEITGLPRQPMTIVALAEQASSQTAEVDLAATPERRDLELMLDLDGRIAGVVVDTQDEPVEGAQVRLMPDFRGGNFSRSEMRLRGFSTVLTDAGGQFEFTGLADQAYRVMASPAGLAAGRRGPPMGGRRNAITAQVGDVDLRIVLPATGGVRGRVAFADGRVPALFTVSAGFRGGATPFATEDGAFTLRDLAPSSYRLSVSGPDFEPKSVEVEVAEGEIVDVGKVVVQQGRKIAGHVVDPSGQPVEGATVTAGRMVFGSGSATGGGRGFPGGNSSRAATTDEAGEFTIYGVGTRDLALIAEHTTRGRSQTIEIPGSTESVLGVELALAPPGAIAGTVTLGGAPAADVMVSAQSKSVPQARFVVATGSDGKYRFDVLAPDSYLVSAMVGNPRHGMGSYSRTVVVSSGQTASGDIVADLGTITLSVTPTAATATGFAFVYIVAGSLSATSIDDLEDRLANRDGGFAARGVSIAGPAEFTQLEPGDYTLCATPFPAEVRPGPEAFEYMERASASLPIFCIASQITATPAEQSIAIPVEIPPFVAPPTSDPAAE